MEKRFEQKFFNKPMSTKVFGIMSVIMLICFMIVGASKCVDTDMFFMIPTGDALREQGFFRNNLWSIDRSSGFIAQQWLYDILLSYLEDIGLWSFAAFVFVELLMLSFIIYKLCKLRNMSLPASMLSIAMAIILGSFYNFTIRPQSITLILVFLECYGFEKFIKTGKKPWLILLPLTTLLEMNIHMSMWFVHFAIALAYICPSFYYKKAEQNNLYKQCKTILPFIAMMVIALFINPYGIDGVTYLFRSVFSDTFKFMEVSEMHEVSIWSASGLIVMLSLVIMYALGRFEALVSSDLNMCLGFIFMISITMRNVMYVPILIVYLYFDIWKYISDNDKVINWKKDVKRYLYVVMIPLCSFLVLLASASVSSLFTSSGIKAYLLDDQDICLIINYLDENADKDTHIFTSINSGAYLEYAGYDQIYVDARPELYSKEFTGDKNIAADYYAYVTDGQRVVNLNFITKEFTHDITMVTTTGEMMEKWLDEYQFEYLITDSSTVYLSGYLEGSDNYERIDFDEDFVYVLYHRIDG